MKSARYFTLAAALASLVLSISLPAAEIQRTRIIGFSQVGQPKGGWFVAGGVFESMVDDARWELLWNGGAGVDRWQDPDYVGWTRNLISPCPGDVPPDRVLLSVSGPYGEDVEAWAKAITTTVATITAKLPSVQHIILQPVVGGPTDVGCAGSGRSVRAAQQFPFILTAIQQVVAKPGPPGVTLSVGYAPRVESCDEFADALGHLTPAGAESVAGRIAQFYLDLDASPRPNAKP